MSATFKNAKKKLSQSELRKFMNEHKEKAQKSTKKIESPLAKYNESGQLTCILCQSIVRSEAVWTVHINAKQHRQNVEQAKKLKEKTNNFTTAVKRGPSPPPTDSNKKIKGILKNAPAKPAIKSNIEIVTEKKGLPEDFFDSASKKEKKKDVGNVAMEVDDVVEEPEVVQDAANGETLPEGFFDDPKLDAKARNVEYKDPIEEEWEKFQKEIKDADHASAAIIAEDQEEATNERQIDEIEEQMKNWSRVVHLERKKVEIISAMNEMQVKIEERASSSEDEDFDEYLDWRAKKA